MEVCHEALGVDRILNDFVGVPSQVNVICTVGKVMLPEIVNKTL